MANPLKILHIDPDYKVTYFINRLGSLIRSPVSLKTAIINSANKCLKNYQDMLYIMHGKD